MLESASVPPGGFGSLPEIGCVGPIEAVSGRSILEAPARIFGTVRDGSFVGGFSYTQPGSDLSAARIGRFCSIASGAVIGPGEHPVDWLSTHPFTCDPTDSVVGLAQVYPDYRNWLGAPISKGNLQRPVEIGSDVWIGQNALVMRGVKIHHGAIVAAGAVVTRDVEPYMIVGGIPAKPIRTRVPEALVPVLLDLQWWTWDLTSLTGRIDYSDLASAIAIIQNAVDRQELKPLVLQKYLVDGGRAVSIRPENLGVASPS